MMLNIVKEKHSNYCVVISATATEAEQYAAEQLVGFIFQSLGVRLPTITDTNLCIDESKCYISIGDTKILEYCNFGVDYSTLNKEGFFIKSKGYLIVLSGANERAKIYAVYDFLEKFIGIRFLTAKATHIPKKSELTIQSPDIIEVPAFEQRDIFASVASDLDFCTKVRVSSAIHPKSEKKYGGSYHDMYIRGDAHSFHFLLPPDKYKEIHPEWYEGSNGKQLCLTNSELEKEMINVIIDLIKDRPNVEYLFVSLMDSASLCTCEKCSASHERTGAQAGTLVIFLNKVAREVNKWLMENRSGRKVIIESLAYDWTFPPPVIKKEDGSFEPSCPEVVPDENVLIKMAGIDIDYFHKLDDPNNKYNKRFFPYMQGWASLTKNLAVYDYACCFASYLYYYANFYMIAEYYKRYRDLGVKSILTQHNGMNGETDFQACLRTYLCGKLMWNPDLDTKSLIQEFCDLYFGEDIAPFILRTMRRFDDFYETMYFYGKGNNLTSPPYLQPVNIPAILLVDCIKILDEAEQILLKSNRMETEKAEVLQRIRSFKVTPEFMLFKGWDTYFPNDEEGKKKIAEQFFANAELCGIKYHMESWNVNIDLMKKQMAKGEKITFMTYNPIWNI